MKNPLGRRPGGGRTLLTKVLRLGPALLLPIVYIWADTCYRIGSGEARDWWRVYPFAAVMVVAVLWHLALIVVGKDKLYYAMYALWHVPVFLFAIFFACMYATRAAWL
jgi:hypothetical protein